MFASVRSYRFEFGTVDELMHRVDRDFADALSGEPGFVSYLTVDTGNRTVMSVSVFSAAEGAEQSNELAAEWVTENLAEFGIERMGVRAGEVMVSRAASDALAPVHH